MRASVSERFWSKVEKTPTCWIWTASLHSTEGYGRFALSHERTVQAHRWAYEALVGQIPEGLTIDHLCRVRACVNPAHLEPTTVRVNTLRGFGPTAKNARKTACPRGHVLSGANLIELASGRRRCWTCQRAHDQAYKDRQRVAVLAAAETRRNDL